GQRRCAAEHRVKRVADNYAVIARISCVRSKRVARSVSARDRSPIVEPLVLRSRRSSSCYTKTSGCSSISNNGGWLHTDDWEADFVKADLINAKPPTRR